jgi:CBS domain-containing protein
VAEPEVERDGRLHVGSVASAMSPVVHVARNQPIERAQTLMMRDDYSQLAVMAGSRSLDGAVSWESIARASLRGDVTVVADALVSEVVIVNLDDDLLATVPRIIENGFVFVRARDAQISGIVTTADLSSLFVDLANPFLLVGEIERVLRRLAERHFSVDELATMRDPADASRRVSRVSDLTFGEHARLLEDPSRWGRLGWRIDRALFLERLHQVREIRNEVMHFSPDPLDADDVEKLKGFIRWLRELEPAL